MSSGAYNVLFLCKSNSARSIMAEAVINLVGESRFWGFSAGSQPFGKVSPLALKLLERHQFAIHGLRSKSWDEFAAPDAPHMDFVITLCDQAKAEVCPEWPGNPITAHWGIPDPSAVKGTLEERMAAFRGALRALERRIRIFASLRPELLDRMSIKQRVDEIGAADSSGEVEKRWWLINCLQTMPSLAQTSRLGRRAPAYFSPQRRQAGSIREPGNKPIRRKDRAM